MKVIREGIVVTKVLAHRGSAGTHPENTIISFSEAVRVGADGIELDVHLTKDNEIVVIHDHTLERTTNGKGRVIDHSLKEIKKLDAGTWFSGSFQKVKVPTLGEVLFMMQENNLLINIEYKNVIIDYIGLEERVMREIERYDVANRVIVSSFNHYSLKRMNDLNPKIECAVLYMEKIYEPWNYANMLGAKSLHSPFHLVNNKIIQEAKKGNVSIRAYTVNHTDDVQRLMKEKCSAIITDYPEKALKIREKM